MTARQDDAGTKLLRNLRRRVDRARRGRGKFVVSCPASRHLHMMVDVLATGRKYHMFEEEPEYCAETLLAVLESLWKLRAASPEWQDRAEAAFKSVPQ